MPTEGKRNVVLLGDSIFDNSAYIAGERDVCQQLQSCLPEGWQAALLAVDGDNIRHISDQLARLPQNASHLIISIGGNDALGQMNVLGENVPSISDALTRMAEVSESFQRDYHKMVQEVLKRKTPTALCTI